MDNKNADIHIMATLDDICWTFNIRGCDVECNPVIMAYSVITKDEAYIYTDKDRFDDKTLAKFGEACVEVLPYDSIMSLIHIWIMLLLPNQEMCENLMMSMHRL